MTLNYPDGTILEALLLSRSNDTLSAAVQGEDAARNFTLAGGTWISEECEPGIEFAWERRDRPTVPTETDFVCSDELAARLTSMLLVDSNEDELMEDMLWVISAEGHRIRIHQSQMNMACLAAELTVGSMHSMLSN